MEKARRSLQASSEGIKKAQRALIRCSLTQTALAADLGYSRQPIGKFFNGKRVDRYIFVDICERLNLDWEEVIPLPNQPELEPNPDTSINIDIDALVQEIREKARPSIQESCGTMRVLDMSQPIELNDIYTHVNILEKITRRKRKKIAELLQECNSEDFERFGLGIITEERVPGRDAVEKYNKLIILGKPGAGKTTFLKYVALHCNNCRSGFSTQLMPPEDGLKTKPALSPLVPIFITLKDFAEATNKPGLLQYINQQFSGCQVEATQVADLLKNGRALILLDGLDEVREEDNRRILKEIRELSDEFWGNHFVMTCRIAAREYTFEKFTEVEVADFDDEQISTFATKWFKDKAVKAESFLKRLEQNYRIKQLATSPLLLTLLCLAFEESGDFPANRSELYKEGLDSLLKKWDAKRRIQRDQVYKKLSPQRKEDLLSKIALNTFKRGDYFFKQQVAEQYITNYICNLLVANTDPEDLQLDSEVVLRSIEAQHGLLVARAKGIYSFSHLTFHEYFTAREIVSGTQPLEEALQNLVSKVTEARWREVFLLAVGMLPSADHLFELMKQQVDALVVRDKKLQQLLMWVSKKSLSVHVPYKPAAVRAFYLTLVLDPYIARNQSRNLSLSLDRDLGLVTRLSLDIDLDRDLAHALEFASERARALALDRERARALARALTLDLELALALARALTLDLELALDLARILNPEMGRSLQELKDESPDPDKNIENFNRWWEANGQAWTEQLRAVMIQYRDIGHDWQFSDEQKKVLKQYYDTNLFLVECLNSDCYVSREVRSHIEDTLLLPIAEIENRKHG